MYYKRREAIFKSAKITLFKKKKKKNNFLFLLLCFFIPRLCCVYSDSLPLSKKRSKNRLSLGKIGLFCWVCWEFSQHFSTPFVECIAQRSFFSQKAWCKLVLVKKPKRKKKYNATYWPKKCSLCTFCWVMPCVNICLLFAFLIRSKISIFQAKLFQCHPNWWSCTIYINKNWRQETIKRINLWKI